MEPLFPLGQIVITCQAKETIPAPEVLLALNEHSLGKWGDLSESDRQENELSLNHGFRLLSSYTSQSGDKFWIITEADRSSTTILLPSDY